MDESGTGECAVKAYAWVERVIEGLPPSVRESVKLDPLPTILEEDNLRELSRKVVARYGAHDVGTVQYYMLRRHSNVPMQLYRGLLSIHGFGPRTSSAMMIVIEEGLWAGITPADFILGDGAMLERYIGHTKGFLPHTTANKHKRMLIKLRQWWSAK